MKKALEMELYKLSKNSGLKLYYLLMSLLLICETTFAYNLWKGYHDIWLTYGGFPSVLSMYWIGGDVSSVFLSLYYILFPIMAVLPFSVTYYTEIKNGYAKNVCSRVGKKRYILAKYIVSYITGAFACSIPLLINLGITALYTPDIPQNPLTFNSSVTNSKPWGEIFYESPLQFAFIYIGLAFLYGGVFAVFTMSIVYMCRNIFVYCMFGFLINVSCYYIFYNTKLIQFVPSALLDPSQFVRYITYQGIIVTFVFMLAVSVIGICIHMRRDILR